MFQYENPALQSPKFITVYIYCDWINTKVFLEHYITLPLTKTDQNFKVTCQIQYFRTILNTQNTEEQIFI